MSESLKLNSGCEGSEAAGGGAVTTVGPVEGTGSEVEAGALGLCAPQTGAARVSANSQPYRLPDIVSLMHLYGQTIPQN